MSRLIFFLLVFPTYIIIKFINPFLANLLSKKKFNSLITQLQPNPLSLAVFLSSSDFDFLETKTSQKKTSAAATATSGRDSLLLRFDPFYGRPSVYSSSHLQQSSVKEEPLLLSPVSSESNGNVVNVNEEPAAAADHHHRPSVPALNDTLPLSDSSDCVGAVASVILQSSTESATVSICRQCCANILNCIISILQGYAKMSAGLINELIPENDVKTYGSLNKT